MKILKKAALSAIFMAITAIGAMAQQPADSASVATFQSKGSAKLNATLTTGADGNSLFLLTDSAGRVVYSHSTETVDTASMWLWNLELNLPKKKNYSFRTRVFGSVLVGLTHPIDAPAGVKNYWEMNIPDLIGVECKVGRSTYFSIGLGMSNEWFKTDGKGMRLQQQGKALALVPKSEGMRKVDSDYSVFSIVVPFTFTQHVYRHFGFSLSAAASFSTFAGASTSYTLDGLGYKEKYKDLHLRPVTADFTASIGWTPGVSVYVKYSPWSKFSNGYGPQFKMLSYGLRFSF